ncbi:acyloxyacyl hydrolase [Pusillimonas sp. MFBS29]|uniref:acyloxyacyl hydrolase n=1 Tax=Pusillimonas sp. MFBS29 TaxID=2886690 RepID=UPI001D10E6E3|nr:acyloxyacyl hydrolase [Pusillimonas sp. MFBS29]MCC2594973.1 acyloxyacyl hydrolase [Pusillimonas sp. MFBS29]
MARTIKNAGAVTAVLVAMFFTANAGAADPAFGGISVRAGYSDNYNRAELAWESPSLWTYRFSEGYGRLDLVAELGAAYWMANGSRSRSSVWQFSATPLLRWTWSERYYLEAGVGATVFSHTTFADKQLSTAFQFGDHIGIGAHLSDSSRLGLRFSHYSNAGIKRPNPGLNILQLMYTHRY